MPGEYHEASLALGAPTAALASLSLVPHPAGKPHNHAMLLQQEYGKNIVRW